MMSTTAETTQAPSATRLEDILKKDGRLVYRGVGVSMKPLIREGVDLVDIRADREIKPFDIVLYRRRVVADGMPATKYVLHRVLADEGDHYLVLGDNCVNTERVLKDDVLGKAETILRNGKAVKNRGLAHAVYMNLWIRPWKMRTRLLRMKFRLRRGIANRFSKRSEKKSINQT